MRRFNSFSVVYDGIRDLIFAKTRCLSVSILAKTLLIRGERLLIFTQKTYDFVCITCGMKGESVCFVKQGVLQGG